MATNQFPRLACTDNDLEVIPALRRHPLSVEPVSTELAVEMTRLFHGVVAQLEGDGGKVIQFVAPAGGAGTSTIVTAFGDVVGQDFKTPVVSVPVGSQPSINRDAIQTWRLNGLVLLDSAPLNNSPSSLAATRAADGTILVVEAERTTRAEVDAALKAIERCGGRCLGIVFNKRRRYLPRFLESWI